MPDIVHLSYEITIFSDRMSCKYGWNVDYLKLKITNPYVVMNKDIIKCFKTLIHIVNAKDDKGASFKIREYTDTIKAISESKYDIKNIDDAKDILISYGKKNPTKTLLKIEEILNTGTLRIIEETKTDPLVKAVIHLTKIYSIGNKKAIHLYKQYNITTILELKQLVDKNPNVIHNKQKIGLTYYDDLIQRIPRDEMLEYQRVLLDIANKVDSEIQLSINGSFRRECETSGDIDVLITSNNPTSRKKFIQYLKNEHILIETLASGKKKYMGISKLHGYNTYRHIDIIETTLEEYAFGILYFTGSGGFNVQMRKHALTKGYTLNEYCLSHYDTKINVSVEEIQSKIGKSYFETELDIFQFLELEYVEPKDRDNITPSKM